MKILKVLLLLFFLPALSHGQEKLSYDIGILLDISNAELDTILDSLKSEIKAVVGEDAVIHFPEENILSNNLNLIEAEDNYQTLLRNSTDIIIAFGQINNAIISAQDEHLKPTILFGTLNLDLVDLDEEKNTSGINNFAYLISSQSYTRDLQSFQSLYNFSKVGVIIDKTLTDGLTLDTSSLGSLFNRIFDALDASYVFIPYKSPSDLEPHLDEIDAVYVAEGFLLSSGEISALADRLFEEEIASFTSTPRQDVVAGLMATNQAEENLGQFFRRVALYVEAVVNGQNLSELPLYIEFGETLTVNYNTAEKVGVPIRYSQVATIDFVGDFKNVISEETYNIIDLIEGVLDDNLILQIGEKNVALSEEDIRLARSNYLPSLTASASGTYNDKETAELSNGSNPEYATSGNVTLTQTIFSDAASSNIEIQKSLLKAEQENYKATELDLILNAANAYFNALILKSNLQIRSENLNVTKRNLNIALQNFEAGQTGRTDVLRFQSEQAQNMQALVEAVNQLEQGFYAINQLLNDPIEREIDIADADITDELFDQYNYDLLQEFLDDPSLKKVFVDFLVDQAKSNAPELRALNYNMEVIERSILLNGSRRFLPTVSAQAQYNRTFDQWGVGVPPPEFTLDENFSAGVNLTIPLVDRNQRKIERQISIIQKEQLELNQKNTALSIERNVNDAVLGLVNQIANIQLSQVAEEAARQSLELTQAAYSSGAVNIVQLLDAQNNLVGAQLARANANYNLLLSSIILERYIGYFFLLNPESENDAFRQKFLEYQETARELQNDQ